MSATDDPLHGIDRACETLESYSGLHSARACVLYPNSVDQLQQIFAYARSATPRRHHVTFRSGGHSFDAQSLGDDLVVCMKHFNRVDDPRVEERLVRVEAGATWGAILAKVQPHGLVPAVTVTTENATAGGTLSGDCLSRFSPAWGKEGKWVASFELLRVDGTTLVCSPPDDGREPSTLAERVFMATIGGLGYVGAVLSITYKLLPVAERGQKIGVRTEVRKQQGFSGLASALIPAVMKTYDEPSDPRDRCKHDAIYSALAGRAKNRQTLLFTSAFTTSLDRHRMLLFRSHFLPRVFVEWGFRWSAFNRLLWMLAYRWGYPPWVVYLDDLEGFTFFMDGNVRAKRVARKLFHVNLKTLQQTFVVPCKTELPEDWTSAENELVRWLKRAEGVLDAHKLTPTLHDVLFLPRDERFPLSMTADRAGFAVTYAFETSKKGTLDRADEAFRELADILLRDFEGRVYLVKNVCASPATLKRMYGANADEFFKVKAEVDPDCILRNGFLEMTFGDRLPAT